MTKRSHRVGLVLVAASMLAAGCAGAVTTSPPPGVTETSVTDTNALVGAHTAELNSTSFTVQERLRFETVNGSRLISYNKTYHVDTRGAITGRLVSRTDAAPGAPDRYTRGPDRVEAWRNGTTTYVRQVDGRNVTYRQSEPFASPVKLGPILYRRALLSLANRENTSVRRVEVANHRGYRITAALNETRFRRNASIALYVTGDGMVRRLNRTYTLDFRSRQQRVVREVQYSDIGSTTPERPEWYPLAVNRTDDT